ncbi:hypothetical protein IOQ59_19445 [Pontibacterium sp. N1Y112]|uniref:DUF2157 domain-containing protein n=1 Tax=Pontibacterium sinense TaxID=2781979 RepID=A0A8J7FK17_9GAMM|nr:hypothetical protein [Pontibacterium sinense]MBE9399443.1 hypothetical protein [Pontibacterium sinense]
MYTDEDLNFAVKKGVFTDSAVEEFRALLSSSKHSPSVDEENFKLVGGFNDIFIVIACLLLIFSSLWVVNFIAESDVLGMLVFTVLSWILSEIFVLKRKMALPGIALLLAFVGGVYSISDFVVMGSKEMSFMLSAALATIAAYLHWLRFKVPITIAVGTAAAVGLLVSLAMSIFPDTNDSLLVILFICGVLSFIFAMYWDSSDTKRITRNSDVAFWLHLLSAPLIIHPVFSKLGVLDGNESLVSMAAVVVLYVFMTSISIVIDRRAFMVSSLVYVLYALSSLIKAYGGVGYSFALTGVLMGGALLLLSVFWHRVRVYLVAKLPAVVKENIPEIREA